MPAWAKTIPMHLTHRTFALGMALMLLLPVQDQAEGQEGNMEAVTLTVGFSKASFIGVSRNDAEAAFKAFIETVGRNRGYLMKTQTEVFDSVSDIEAAIKKRSVILFVFDTWDYLSLRNPELIEPQFLLMEGGVLARRYLLLTRRGSGFNKLPDLRGKDIEILENVNCNLAKIWLEALLLVNRLGAKEAFFSNVEVVAKASTAVLSVFFGKKHACVVDESALAIMSELNPQVGKTLQTIAVSEPYVDSMIAFSRSEWGTKKQREDVYRGLAELHLEAAGQQILTLFKCNRMVPYEEAQIDTVKELWATYHRLLKE